MATDPRVPRSTTPAARLGTPLSPPSYSTYTGTIAGGAFAPDTWMRTASGLEARYIVAEAQGPTAATLTFVNERRAAGAQGLFGGTDAELRDELLDQRMRDFFLDGHRIGDLRRYKTLYGLDLWPSGRMPGLTQEYGTQECWPVAQSEINANPNI